MHVTSLASVAASLAFVASASDSRPHARGFVPTPNPPCPPETPGHPAPPALPVAPVAPVPPAHHILPVLPVSPSPPGPPVTPGPPATPGLARPPFGQVITQCTTPGLVALTFDDGPFDFTSQLLDLLDAMDAKATFFLVGENFGRRMDEQPWAGITQRMFQSGHQLASHSFSHPDLDTLSSADRASQMQLNDDMIRSNVGVAPTYMRPPFLSCGEQCLADMASLGYLVIDTSLDTKDFENNTPETIFRSEQKFDAELGSPGFNAPIVLAHDVHETTVTVLAAHMIQTLRAQGFQPVTVGECLGDAPENWYRA